jgi:hypothetical protein
LVQVISEHVLVDSNNQKVQPKVPAPVHIPINENDSPWSVTNVNKRGKSANRPTISQFVAVDSVDREITGLAVPLAL